MGNDQKYKVSILLPTLSTEFISEALYGIANQNFDHSKIELLIISTGLKQADIESQFPENFDIATRILTCEARGISASLNLGLEESNAPYIARIDADDIMLPERIASQVRFLDDNPEYAVVGGHINLINKDSEIVGSKKYVLSDEQIRSTILEKSPVAHPAVMLRKEFVQMVGGYRLLPSEDTDLWIRILPFWKIANLDQFVINYRVHPNQTSNYSINSTSIPRDLVWISHFLRLKSERDLPDSIETAPQWIKNYKYEFRRNILFKFTLARGWLVHPHIERELTKARGSGNRNKIRIASSLLLRHPRLFLSWIFFRVLRILFVYFKLSKRIGF